MKKAILFFIFFLPLFSNAQKNISLQMQGVISVDKNNSTYNLELMLLPNMDITGISISNPNSKEEIKASLVGKWNKEKNTIFFKENKIISSKIKGENIAYCLIESTLQYATKNNKIVMTGKYIGKTTSGATCAKGIIALTGNNTFTALNTPEIDVKKSLQEVLDNSNISFKKINYYDYENQNLTIDISDYDQEDGDTISVFVNNKPIVEKYELTKKSKTIFITTSPNHNDTLYLYAHNEGYYPPNSAQLVIHDGNKSKKIIATNEYDKKVYLILRKKTD